ncbi:unnamed protein product [Phaeothamnion confervicola]
MPRLSLLGVDEATRAALARLRAPVMTAESLLTRPPERLAEELNVSLRAVRRLQYKVACKCQTRRSVHLSYEKSGDADSSDSAGGHSQEERNGQRCSSPSFQSAAALYRMMWDQGGFSSSGSPRVDALLLGGIMRHQVTEVVGDSASGKSQLCMTAAVCTAWGGAHVLFIDTGRSADAVRMREIAMERFGRDLSDNELTALLAHIRVQVAHDVYAVLAALEGFHEAVASGRTSGKMAVGPTTATAAAAASAAATAEAAAASTGARAWQRSQCGGSSGGGANGESAMPSQWQTRSQAADYSGGSADDSPGGGGGGGGSYRDASASTASKEAREDWHLGCRLVILDSATAVLGPIVGGDKNVQGHGMMASLGHTLNKIATRCSVGVLVTNNTVSDRRMAPAGGCSGFGRFGNCGNPDSFRPGSYTTGQPSDMETKPALGPTWAYVASARLFLQHHDSAALTGAGERKGRRTANLVKHSARGCHGAVEEFEVGAAGVTDAMPPPER